MFQQKSPMAILREGSPEAETVIAASVKVEGDFTSQGNILIEGTVEGKLTTSKDLRVGERARISADVTANNAVIAGEIRGNLVCAEKLELEPTARVMGDVRTKILIVSAGATVNGRIMMGPEAEKHAASAAAPKAPEMNHNQQPSPQQNPNNQNNQNNQKPNLFPNQH